MRASLDARTSSRNPRSPQSRRPRRSRRSRRSRSLLRDSLDAGTSSRNPRPSQSRRRARPARDAVRKDTIPGHALMSVCHVHHRRHTASPVYRTLKLSTSRELWTVPPHTKQNTKHKNTIKQKNNKKMFFFN